MITIGIDPGLSGGVAILNVANGCALLQVFDTPTTVTMTKSGQRKTLYVEAAMVRLLEPYATRSHAYLEAVHAMPGQGVTSMFRMGYGFGLWVGMLSALKIPYSCVAPQTWKRIMLPDMGKDKGASRLRAMQLFPHQAECFQRVKDDGRADAALLSEYGRRLHDTQAR